MYLSENEIENGFWYHRRDESFPPPSTTYPKQNNGETHLNIVCTQLDISSYQQKKLVNQWCKLIPELVNMRYLWFSSRVNQSLLEACCENQNIEGLYLKWGAIKDISGLKNMQKLKFLHIGSAPSVESISVFSEMTNLIVLEIENINKIQDISPIGSLKQLEGLAIEGSMWTTQVVESISPLCDLENLRYIFLANLRTLDKTIKPLSEIKTLMNIRTSFWYPKSEFKLLRERLPALKYGTPFQTDLIERFGK